MIRADRLHTVCGCVFDVAKLKEVVIVVKVKAQKGDADALLRVCETLIYPLLEMYAVGDVCTVQYTVTGQGNSGIFLADDRFFEWYKVCTQTSADYHYLNDR